MRWAITEYTAWLRGVARTKRWRNGRRWGSDTQRQMLHWLRAEGVPTIWADALPVDAQHYVAVCACGSGGPTATGRAAAVEDLRRRRDRSASRPPPHLVVMEQTD